MTVWCRPETPEDERFVRQLLVNAILDELGAHAWPEPVRAPLISLQYQARRSGARAAAGDVASQIIVADGEDAGWLLVADLGNEMRIIEIAVLPLRRGQGIGSAALGAILERAAGERKAVTLTVNGTNTRAIRLYERLGFRVADGDQVQSRMAWTPPAGA